MYKRYQILLVVCTAFLFTVAVVLLPFYGTLSSIVYDIYMRNVRGAVQEDPALMLVDIDDTTMNQQYVQYSWPWPRYVIGDAVEVLADFGVQAAVFDIEFLGKSVAGVNVNEVERSKAEVNKTFQKINTDFASAVGALADQPSILRDPSPLLYGFENTMNGYSVQVSSYFDKMAEDNDLYFAKRLAYLGKAYGTVNMVRATDHKEDTQSESYQKSQAYLKKYGFNKKELLKNTSSHQVLLERNIAEFPDSPIGDQFKKVGFTAVVRDKDSSTRNIALFMEKDGMVIPQLAFAPLLDLYHITAKDIDLSHKNRVVLHNVVIGGQKREISIPVHNGMMRINWPAGEFKDIFVSKELNDTGDKHYHFSFARLLYYKYVLMHNFERALDDFSSISDEQIASLRQQYDMYAQSKQAMIDGGMMLTDELRGQMNSYFDQILMQLAGVSSEERLSNIIKEIELASGMSRADKDSMVASLKVIMNNMHDATETLIQYRDGLKKALSDKICFIGLTATGTSDIGSNPFDNTFENVGTHPAVFNTIIKQEFIHVVPDWLLFIFALLFFSGISLFIIDKEAIMTALIGLSAIIAVILLSLPSYHFADIYISPLIPVIYGFFFFMAMVIMKFILSEKDKQFIRSTFDRYLSPVVINDLIKQGGQVELGGERRNCTAMFTDIEGFSSFSEKFMDDPKGLVVLLNEYLSAMSDIIMENGGTIDKYEGDAIIAFFGAPLHTAEHPFHACLSSLRMKEIENSLNKSFTEKGLIDKPIHTRIGINTGDMFVGNMGTYRRLEYTMIGHAVNLAARLEGVNKQYRTYQLISEYTYKSVANEFYVRKLDAVRVVNINTPIRLYELIGLKSETSQEIIEALAIFHRGLDLFEKREYKEALALLSSLTLANGFDKTTAVYIDRCKKFIETPPPDTWDGVYNLTTK